MTKTKTTEKPPAGDKNVKELARAKEDYEALLRDFQSIHLATVAADGSPEASYAPAVIDEARNLYVYVSELSAHTGNLLATGKASALIIEDEAACASIFARRRVSFDCTVREIERHSTEWGVLMERFTGKFGDTMHRLREMADFHLIRLRPKSGRLVLGFGRAYDVTGETADTLVHVRGNNGQGHRKDKKSTESAS